MSDRERSRVRLEKVSAERAGQRLDNFLMSLLGPLPRGLIYRLVRTGQVRVNGSRAKPMRKLAAGDEVRVPPVAVAGDKTVSLPEGLVERVRRSIVERNDHYVILDKPAGLAMHGGSGLSFGLMDAIARIDPNWRPVHRLDRPTSGLLVLACHHQALRSLQQAFMQHQVDKRYLALLDGRLPEACVRVDEPLKKIRDASGQHRVIVDPDGQSARSTFRLLESIGRFSYVEVILETGRTHQIRAHAKFLGLPLVGDELYNPAAPPAPLDRLFLHAHYLRLPWPEDRLYSSPLPDALTRALAALRVA